jgi:acyl-CoA thioesterase-2
MVADEGDTSLRLASLIELLDLRPLPGMGTAGAFEGVPQPVPADRMFGGLLLAQALVAAGRTVNPALEPLSLQADFAGGVPTDTPVRYAVHEIFDAASMAGRAVAVTDSGGRQLFSATARFADTRTDLPSYSTVKPRTVPGPDEVTELHERFAQVPGVPAWWAMERPVEFRHVEHPPYVERVDDRIDRQTVWFRTRGRMPDDRLLHAAVLAYVSDMSTLEPAFRMLGGTRHGPGSRILSVNHSMWFHLPATVDTWHQIDQRTPVMSHGRTLGHAEILDDAGTLVATVSQLGLVKAAAAHR